MMKLSLRSGSIVSAIMALGQFVAMTPCCADRTAAVYYLPNTPNGLKPTQSWDAVGSTPSGDIYVGGMDHVSNAALYRFRPATGSLEYVGDARSASEAANNWLAGETVQKFHTRPLWYGGKVYVATLNYSSLDDTYLQMRGFKWYAYDEATSAFTDLSASVPGGTAIEKGGIVALSLAPSDHLFYAMTIPTAEIVSYDPNSNVTTQRGRPSRFNKAYIYSARFMWVDSQGRLYLSAGNPDYSPQTGTPDDPAVFGHIYYYDPGQGFGEATHWSLVNVTAIQSGQWALDRQACYMMDDRANLFLFDDRQRSFERLGQVPVTQPSWVFQLSANGKKIYIIEGRHDSEGRLFEFDIGTRQYRLLCSLSDLAPSLLRGDVCGFDSWDRDGRFYITSGNGQDNVALIQIDPVLVKVAFGQLPALMEVELALANGHPDTFTIVRRGDTTAATTVLYSARTVDDPADFERFYTAVVPQGQTAVEVLFPRFSRAGESIRVDLIPDGDTYKVGPVRSVIGKQIPPGHRRRVGLGVRVRHLTEAGK
jgi:hypothetical protein